MFAAIRALFAIFLSLLAFASNGEEVKSAVTEDGRAVVLFPDGTWTYKVESARPQNPETERPAVVVPTIQIPAIPRPRSIPLEEETEPTIVDPVAKRRVAPVYPVSALSRGINGWVEISYTVTSEGLVTDPEVLETCSWTGYAETHDPCPGKSSSMFNKAALRAVREYIYAPKTVDGQPVDAPDVKSTVTFVLVDD